MFGTVADGVLDWTFEDVSDLVGDEHDHVARGLERQLRIMTAELAVAVASAERKEVYALDGHTSVLGWARVATHEGTARCQALRRLGRALLDLPLLAKAAGEGTLGLDQMELFARAYANPRCGDQLADYLPTLVQVAQTMALSDFRLVLGRWEQVNDPDGAHDDTERVHSSRRAGFLQGDESFTFFAFGDNTAGVQMNAVFEQYVQAEFEADWAVARALYGESATVSTLARTDPQRRFDALRKLFQDAASTPPDSQAREPVVDIVVDELTFEETIIAMFGSEAADRIDDRDHPSHATRRGRDPLRRRCETSDGIAIDPYQVVAAALIGTVRRIVYDSAGVAINLGTRCRLFTGPAKQAIMLATRRCLWPGCEIPSGRCQADHTIEAARGGPTDQTNGGPLCHHHNQWKNRGYKVWRDPTGTWHTYRPDGTEIC